MYKVHCIGGMLQTQKACSCTPCNIETLGFFASFSLHKFKPGELHAACSGDIFFFTNNRMRNSPEWNCHCNMSPHYAPPTFSCEPTFYRLFEAQFAQGIHCLEHNAQRVPRRVIRNASLSLIRFAGLMKRDPQTRPRIRPGKKG